MLGGAEYAVRNADGSFDELAGDFNLDTVKMLVEGFEGSVLLHFVDGEWVEVE